MTSAAVPRALVLERWRVGVPAAGLLGILVIYRDTLGAMAATWSHSETFAHGALVGPLCGVLVWRQREQLRAVACAPYYPALVGIVVLGMAWLVAELAHVQVATQYAMVATLPFTLLTMVGPGFVRAIWFPLAYLGFAVPSGELLIAPLIEFTAGFTVGALDLVGMPVFREGSFISVPSGNWAVADACSGLRYTIASVALGVLYAYFMYSSVWRRLLFVAVSALLPILANGMRAFLIVMIGHWSDMRLATGIDHVVYGTVFFCLVLLLLFWVGGRWRQFPAAAAPRSPARQGPLPLTAMAAALALASPWPLLATALTRAAPARVAPRLSLDTPAGLSAQPAAPIGQFAGARLQFSQGYGAPAQAVTLQIALYQGASAQADLAGADCANLGGRWHRLERGRRLVAINGAELAVQQTLVEAQGQRLLVWCWYRQAGADSANAAYVRWKMALQRLRLRPDQQARIVLATPVDEHRAPSSARLEALLAAMYPTIVLGVDHAGDD